jgi:hypothetical protein
MTKAKIITFIVLVSIFSLIALIFMSYVSIYNYGNRMDNTVKSEYFQMQNVLSQYSQKIQEMVQVPTMYKDDLKEIVQSSMQGRYGKDGSKAIFQFLKEHNQTLDSSLYKKIQQSIEAGRNDFEFENKKLIDIKNEYNIAIGSFYTGIMLRIAGYPKIKLDEFVPISNTYAKSTFEKGYEDTPIKLR